MDGDREDAGLAELRTSARGWHKMQLAVLGFIGLCGVLWGGSDRDVPQLLQVVPGLLVLLALVTACVATALVASAAWPLDAHQRPPDRDGDVLRGVAGRVRRGMALTFVSVALVALAASSSWWPAGDGEAAGTVAVTTAVGALCGELVDSEQGSLTLDVAGRRFVVALADVVSLRAVPRCA